MRRPDGPGPSRPRLEAAGESPIDWPRLLRRLSIGLPIAMAIVELALQARLHELGFDFRGVVWGAGRAILAGHSPYGPANAGWILHRGNAFVSPPLLGELGVPFALLPFTAALLAFDAVGVVALLGALRLIGVRDRRIDLVCLCSFPFVSGTVLGQPDALLALLVALGWRYRDSWRGAVAIGVVIAAKLVGAPLVAWLLFTRRFRQAVIATLTIAAGLLVGFAALGFKGWANFPRLLRVDATVFEARSHSLLAGLLKQGLGEPAALVMTIGLALAIAAAIVVAARGSDLGWFTATITLGLLCSPILWQHYLIVLLIPLAVASRNGFDPITWTLVAGLWLAPSENPHTLWQAWLVPALVAAVGLRAVVFARRAAEHGGQRATLGDLPVVFQG